MIKGFEPRLYQETIFATAAQKNTLVVLPTGMGKTNIFLMLVSDRLQKYPNSKILLIGPTKPLIDQYYSVFLNHFEIDQEKLAIFTGEISPMKRSELWKEKQIIFSTPQGLENDIISRRILLDEVSLLGFDEAHRAVGNYSYVFVAKQYEKLAQFPRIVAMTASPGSDKETIQEVCQNLFIEDIEVRTDQDPDVKPYVKETVLQWVKVDLTPPFLETKKQLEEFLRRRFESLRDLGLLKRKTMSFVNKKDLLAMQAQLRGQMMKGERDFAVLKGISILAEIMKMSHALELLETQGMVALKKYFDKMYSDSRTSTTKALKNILADETFKTAFLQVQERYEQKIEHPKLIELQKLVAASIKNNETKAIVFNQYRDNALDIVEKINTIEGLNARLFVGQQKRGETGMSQKQQKQMLDDFREDQFNVLVATSIGEEGLDIPKVDIVVFYEPVPSAIRAIQRRGRTGRHDKGNVIVLMTKDTRDEAYRYVAQNKERRMHRVLTDLRQNMGITLATREQRSLDSFAPKKEFTIFADYREKGSPTLKELVNKDFVIKLEALKNADYVLSSRVGVEFKTVEDFVDSIIDGRLLAQIKELKRNFERPLVLIEGEDNLYTVRGVHPHAIAGMLATISVSFGVPIIQTKNAAESASILSIIAKREQEEKSADFQLHGDRKPLTLKEQQEYVVSALPGVGRTLSKPLLKHFKGVREIFTASLHELQEVEGIGKVKASDIKKVIDGVYDED